MPTRWSGPEVTLAPTPCRTDGASAAAFGVRVAAERRADQWQLVRTGQQLELVPPQASGLAAIGIDLASGPMARRLRSTKRDEPLPRACGLHRRTTPLRVVDATAGLCRDAMILASLACEVVAIERVPALAFLAHAAVAGSWLDARLRVRCGDAAEYLSTLAEAERPDVVCLDPMFEDHGKAQVKKDMQVCRALAGPPEDVAALFAAAQAMARERVVVKRSPGSAPLVDGVSFAVPGERVRFDVYLTNPARDAPTAQ
ncbi:MAG: class I SAM-dependent methyltransferase [Planctomycetota bacterium]